MTESAEVFTLALTDFNTVCPYTQCSFSSTDALSGPDAVFDASDLNNPTLTLDTDDLTLVGAVNDPFEDYAISVVCADAGSTDQVSTDFTLTLLKPCPLALEYGAQSYTITEMAEEFEIDLSLQDDYCEFDACTYSYTNDAGINTLEGAIT